ncbi:MAG: quinolinate synthase NadA [Planctomycetaceae bacterium]|jgi:quinolinate synthase|nr:quinolinate synthase NadA [Planctomycetaceae bacterium]
MMTDLHHHIDTIRQRLGKRLLILGHHYQREEVIAHTDLQGDSFQLSAAAAHNSDCQTIVFCGVHFMAETADILANSAENLARRGGQRVQVLLPDIEAGCSMADMATLQTVEHCWNKLSETIDVSDVVPITYVNSTAELKAFCGRHGGIACTSTNAEAVLDSALKRKRRVLFFPDQHLGRNTALKMGIAESAMCCWDDTATDDAATPWGGNSAELIQNSRIILWKGYCCVHQKFLPEHVDAIRESYHGIRVIVHPECQRDVVEKADEFGSTSYILKRISESSAGSAWAVGTESRFVERLARQNPDKTVVNLAFQPSYCDTMGLIDLPKLAAMLDSVESGQFRNVIRVDDATATDALRCLQRMLEAV